MNSIPCPVCFALEGAVLCTKEDWQSKPIDIVRCKKCSVLFAHPFPTKEDLGKLYSADYFCCDSPMTGGYEDYERDEPEIRRTFERRLPLFLPAIQGDFPHRVLDVGCATGLFLDGMRSHGWETSGVELSAFGAARSREKHADVFQGDLSAAPFEEGSFDLITLWDVIEHVQNPGATLAACRRLLKPGGLLVLSTPDASAWPARILGSYWLGFRSAGEHLYFFERKTLSVLLRQAGFEVLRISSVGKYMKWDRLLRRLGYYTRIFEWLRNFPKTLQAASYVNPGDTMCVVARRLDPPDSSFLSSRTG